MVGSNIYFSALNIINWWQKVEINQPDRMSLEEIIDNRMVEVYIGDDVLNEEGLDFQGVVNDCYTTGDNQKEVEAMIRLACDLRMTLEGMEDLV